MGQTDTWEAFRGLGYILRSLRSQAGPLVPPRRRQGSLLGSWVICNLVVVGYRGY
jgi:hypothetical protein